MENCILNQKLPVDNVNCIIPLIDTEMEISNGNQGRGWVKFHARVTMQLSPVPKVFIEANLPFFALPLLLLNYGDVVKLRLLNGPEIEAQVLELHIGQTYRGCLSPVMQPVTVIQAPKKLRCVTFKVINYPGIRNGARPAILKSGPWCIEVRPYLNLQRTKKILSSKSGYALTHEGTLQRSDGKSFSVGDAEKILGALHLLLSFARGGSCGLTLISGTDEGDEKVWEQWGGYSTFPWFSLSSWTDHLNEEALSEVWPGFLKIFERTTTAQYDRIHIALYWYLRSNETNDLYAGIIFTQAALERLASEILIKNDEEITKTIGEVIRVALECIRVDPSIPKSLEKLNEFSQGKGDGPMTLVKIRNNLVHAKMSEDVSLDACTEARDLGQWYVELFLLWLIGYEGRYASRLAHGYESTWEPKAVPWSCGNGEAP